MKPLITPTINLNGNSADSLIEQLRAVLDGIHELEAAMAKAHDVVHGRNFQLAKDPYAERAAAHDAWHERQVMIDQLDHEVTNLAISIQNQKR